MSTKKIELENIGTIFLKKRKVKNINIRITSEGINVSLPWSVSFKSAEEIVYSKKEWIYKHYTNTKKKESKSSIFSDSHFCLRDSKVSFQSGNIPNIKIQKYGKDYIISYPESFKKSDLQKKLQHYIIEICRIEAKDFLPKRVNELAEKFHFEYNRVYVKNMRSRWGSCSNLNNINLNLHLIRIPDHLIDYVILHELTHTIHKNHSQEFWKQLMKVLPSAKELDKKLKDYSPLNF